MKGAHMTIQEYKNSLEHFIEHNKENGANEDFLYGCLCMMNYAVKVVKSCLIEQKVEKHDAE